MKTCSKGTYGCTITSGPHRNCWTGKKTPKRGSGRRKTTARGDYFDDENIYNSPSIRQSIEEDRK